MVFLIYNITAILYVLPIKSVIHGNDKMKTNKDTDRLFNNIVLLFAQETHA